jgi:hypothetical protein
MAIESDLANAQDLLRSAQRRWAADTGIGFDRADRVERLEDNLFQAMNTETRTEFESGDGSELGTAEALGSMYSLISSSALCCKMFDAWRGRPLGDLASALGIDRSYEVHQFEAKHPTGLPGKPPNLDVELQAPRLKPVAIESKFVETYRKATNTFKPSYFMDRAHWSGLESWKRVALAIDEGRLNFVTLHAAQLVKHVLGLSRRYGPDAFTLLYLSYRVPGPAGIAHDGEIDRFCNATGSAVDFRTGCYSDVFSALRNGPPGWVAYMTKRYGLDHRTDRDMSSSQFGSRVGVYLREEDGQPFQLIRILGDGKTRVRQHRWTRGDRDWVRDSTLDWTGAGGSADWEPIGRERAEQILKEHEGPGLFD